MLLMLPETVSATGDLGDILALTGYPTISDNCGDI